MGFETEIDEVQGLYSNYQYIKAKYNQEGNLFTVNFYDSATGTYSTNTYTGHIARIFNVGDYIHILDKDRQVLISIRERDESEKNKIHKKIKDEFYLIAGSKSKSRKSKRRKSIKRKSKRKSRRRSKRRKSKRNKSKKK